MARPAARSGVHRAALRHGPRPPHPAGSLPFDGQRAVLGLAGVACFVALTLPSGLVLSAYDTDVMGQFVAWRSFAASAIKAGDFPLWNPYTYAGQPFLAGFQSALFYPPTAVFLLLPVERALNLTMLLHLIWMGCGMAVWARERGLSPAASALAGVLLPLSGPVFPQVYAGHLSNLCTMAWAPWVFVGLERAWRGRTRRGLPIAAGAAAMQILAGHVQYAFYTAVAAGLFAALTRTGNAALRTRFLHVGLVVAGACALAAVQLAPGLAAASEGLRAGGLPFDHVRAFSFPPENLLTAFAPWFFGTLSVDYGTQVYWGRGYLWEASAFAGAAGIVLGLIALEDRARTGRLAVRHVLLPAILLALAFGGNTPLLRILYDWVPGFASFRGLAKFTFFFMLFAMLAVAAGADTILRGGRPGRRLAIGLALAGSVAIAGGMMLMASPDRLVPWLEQMQQSGENGLIADVSLRGPFAEAAARHAGSALLVAGFIWLASAGAFLAAARRPALRFAPLAIVPLEALAFAGASLGVANLADAVPPACRQMAAGTHEDDRVVNTTFPNNGFLLGRSDAGGNDPAVPKRYAEFVTASEGGSPAEATQHLQFSRLGPPLAMLRVRAACVRYGEQIQVFENATPPLPPVLIVPKYRVLPSRDAVLGQVLRETFNPRAVVLLEDVPDPAPAPTVAGGTARVVSRTSDTLEIDADCPDGGILLVTDPYSRYWTARPVDPDRSPQASYEVLPADYVLRAVPLAPGRHHLFVEYRPPLLAAGAVVSLIAAAVWTVLWLGRGRWNQTGS